VSITGWTVLLNSTGNFSKSAMGMPIDLTHLGDRGAGKKEEYSSPPPLPLPFHILLLEKFYTFTIQICM
jgi:hypothetical protein